MAHQIPTVSISHHRGHAVAVLATSGFEEADILIVDGNGSPWDDLPDDERQAVLPVQQRRQPRGGRTLYETISTCSAAGHTITPIEKHLADKSWPRPMPDPQPPLPPITPRKITLDCKAS